MYAAARITSLAATASQQIERNAT